MIEVGEPIELEPTMAASEPPETVARMGDALAAVEDAAEVRLGRGPGAAS